MPWFGARTVFLLTGRERPVYEERVNVLQADSPDEAIAIAERLAAEYADDEAVFLDLVQVYEMSDELGDGAEVFSLLRESDLPAGQYLSRFFDTGHYVTDLTSFQLIYWYLTWRHHTYLKRGKGLTRGRKPQLVAFLDLSIKDPHKNNHAPMIRILKIKNKSAIGIYLTFSWWRYPFTDLCQ